MEAAIFILSICIPLIAMFFVFYQVFPDMAESTQMFDDFIIENVSSTGYNKSAELTLFRILAVACIILTALFVCGLSRLYHARRHSSLSAATTIQANLSANNSATGRRTAILRALTLALFCFLLSYYASLAGLTVLVQLSPAFALTRVQIFILAGLTALALFICSRFRFVTLRQLMLLIQCVIPFLLVLFFIDRYLYRGTLQRIPYAPFYYVCFGGLLVCFIALAILHVRKYFKSCDTLSLGKLIHPVTAITVFIYNSYSACPMYAQPDQHHHGEQLIPWQQILSLGQTAYEEYTPVSGLFPLVNGFIQNVLLGGTVSDYSPAISIMVMLFCILTMYLVCRHVGGAYGLLFAVCFALPAYNRQYLLLPILLLLFLKELLDRPGLWLKAWIFSCFLAGLYYPLYGAAALIGTLPLGVCVLVRFVRDTDWKKERKRPGFYIGWGLCLLPIVLCIPLLLRMVSHTLVYSGQTTLADGISLYRQSVPDFFLPFLSGTRDHLRLWMYYGVRFFLPMMPFVFGTALLVYVLLKHVKSKDCPKRIFCFGLIGMMLALAVSYTYTLVRADVGMILSRTAPVLIAVFGMFLPVMLLHYGKKLITPETQLLVILFCFALPLIIYPQVSAMKFPDMWIYPNGDAELILDDSDKLFSYYEVPETFISMREIDLPDTSMLGDGFMVADQVHYLTEYAAVMQKCKNAGFDTTYLGMDGQGFYYYLNAKSCATGFIQAGKGYDAQQRLLETIQTQLPVIFLLDSQASYHIYHWVLTGGAYLYCADDRAFYPVEIFKALYPERKTGDDARLAFQATDLGLSPSSFGESLDTLMQRIHETGSSSANSADVRTIDGDVNDVLLLRLSAAQNPVGSTLKITFKSTDSVSENACVTCKIGEGTLLIPMGMNASWLLGDNSEILLTFLGEDGSILSEIPLAQAADYGIEYVFYEMIK